MDGQICKDATAATLVAAALEGRLTDAQAEQVLAVAEKVDVVIALSFFFRGNTTNAELIRQLKRRGKKVIQVAATPYDNLCVPEADALVVTFSAMPRSLEAAADIIYGRESPSGTWPLKDYRL